jgi:MarR family transcriptional regulator, transcriptional regulator for hemolysin
MAELLHWFFGLPRSQLIPKPQEPRGPTGRIRRAHLSMQRCADAFFAPHQITTDQYSLLWFVQRSEGIRQHELASELYTDANTVTAMIARLETRGLIRREICSDDARARRIYLTPPGRRLLNRLSKDWEPMRLKLRELFSGEAGEKALLILGEVCNVMTQTRDEIVEKQAARGKPPVKRRRAAVPISG